ncbi:unnamed protein product [Clavelina lepadiformis]|uniref:Uncharacterized protein n=1 Tax=Clavelina lepadiformis TaxID=159417 RepID=A0ABP0GYJ5_CLALP
MKKAKVSRSSMQQKDTVDESDNNVDAKCFYCNKMYPKSSENDGWIQCSKCMRWAQEACSGQSRRRSERTNIVGRGE